MNGNKDEIRENFFNWIINSYYILLQAFLGVVI
jgi:hypothetical protein